MASSSANRSLSATFHDWYLTGLSQLLLDATHSAINTALQISRFQEQESSLFPSFPKMDLRHKSLKSSTSNLQVLQWRCITSTIPFATSPAPLLITDFFVRSLSIFQRRTQSLRHMTDALKISLKRFTKQNLRLNLKLQEFGTNTASSMTWSPCHYVWKVDTCGHVRTTMVTFNQIPSHRVMAHSV